MTTESRSRAQRRDRWVSWIVIAVFVAALACGWVVKVLAESRTVDYNEGGIYARYPAGWVRADVEEPLLLQVEDRWAEPFLTTLTLQRWPVPKVDNPLATVQQMLTLGRTNWAVYRVLEKASSVSIYGRTALHITFAYAEANIQPFFETAPVVMYGEDYLFVSGDHVYVATITAAEGNYDQAHDVLQNFMASLQVP